MTNLHQLIYALSDALDLVGVDDIYHGKRVAYMALECAKELKLDDEIEIDLFHASLLHDCGVSSSKIHDLLVFTLDWKGAENHCIRGYQLLNLSKQLSHLSNLVLYHHTHYDELLKLNIDKQTALLSNIIFLVDRVDALCALYRKEHPYKTLLTISTYIKNDLKKLSGTFFNPKLVDIFLKISQKEVFWFTLEEEKLHKYFDNYLNILPYRGIDLKSLSEISELFAIFVDAKSTFTAEHSIDVAKLSRFIASKVGFSNEVCTKIEIAGLLHDLGKLRVPDEILDKNSPLSESEFDTIKIHSYETYQILSKIKGLEDIAKWSSQHHEKLNGTGYPYHVNEKEIPFPSRIIAVADIFQALAQRRPYRENLKPLDIMEILKSKMNEGDLDKDVVRIVEKNLQECWEISITHSKKNNFMDESVI